LETKNVKPIKQKSRIVQIMNEDERSKYHEIKEIARSYKNNDKFNYET